MPQLVSLALAAQVQSYYIQGSESLQSFTLRLQISELLVQSHAFTIARSFQCWKQQHVGLMGNASARWWGWRGIV